MMAGIDVEVELVDVEVVLEVVVVSDGRVVVVLDVVVEVLVVDDGSVVVVVVGSDGGGGRGGRSMSRSGNASWEQSMGSPVRPSMKLQ